MFRRRRGGGGADRSLTNIYSLNWTLCQRGQVFNCTCYQWGHFINGAFLSAEDISSTVTVHQLHFSSTVIMSTGTFLQQTLHLHRHYIHPETLCQLGHLYQLPLHQLGHYVNRHYINWDIYINSNPMLELYILWSVYTVHCTVGWSDIALNSIFENRHYAAAKVFL